MGGNDGETTETTREPPKNDQSLNACNFLNNGPIFNLKKFWKALCLLYQMTVETTGKRRKRWEEMTGGNDGETTETTREPPKNDQSLNACNFLNNGPIFNPKKFWKALGLLYQMTVETMETTGGNDGRKRREETTGKQQKRRGNHLKITNL